MKRKERDAKVATDCKMSVQVIWVHNKLSKFNEKMEAFITYKKSKFTVSEEIEGLKVSDFSVL